MAAREKYKMPLLLLCLSFRFEEKGKGWKRARNLEEKRMIYVPSKRYAKETIETLIVDTFFIFSSPFLLPRCQKMEGQMLALSNEIAFISF